MSIAPARFLRAVLVGLTVAGTAAAAHHFAGGCFDAPVVAMLAGGFALAAYPLTRRRVETPQFVGLLVLGQLVVHAASCCSVPTDHMLLSHVVATLVSAALLRRGESLLWRLAELAGLRAPRIVVRPLGLVVGRISVAYTQVARSVVLYGGLVNRGPPAALAR